MAKTETKIQNSTIGDFPMTTKTTARPTMPRRCPTCSKHNLSTPGVVGKRLAAGLLLWERSSGFTVQRCDACERFDTDAQAAITLLQQCGGTLRWETDRLSPGNLVWEPGALEAIGYGRTPPSQRWSAARG